MSVVTSSLSRLRHSSLHPEDEKGHKEYAKSLTQDHREAVKGYTSIHYVDHNRALRKGSGKYNKSHVVYQTPEDAHKEHKLLREATGYRLKHPTKVYRALGDTDLVNTVKELKPGSHIVDHGYVSTSHNPNASLSAFGRAEHTGSHKVHHLVKIHLPKGTQVGHVPHHVETLLTKQEQETILHPGCKFKVMKHTYHELDHNPAHDPERSRESAFDRNNHRLHITHVKLVAQRGAKKTTRQRQP